MVSTYTDNTGIEIQVTGENSGTWGDKTNNNLKIIDTILKSSACLFYSKKSLKKKGVKRFIKLLSSN